MNKIWALLLILLAAPCYGAAYTTEATGNWSDDATWAGSGVPGNGDTATVNHAVTITTNTTIGTSPAEANVVVTATANITVNSGVTLTLRGDMTLANCVLTLGSGSGNAHLVFDASAATDPTNQNYIVQIGTANNQNSVLVDINGTTGAHCTVTSNASGGNGYFTSAGFARAGSLQADYCDFSDIGTAALEALDPWISSNLGQQFWLKHCTFTDCGGISSQSPLNMGDGVNYEVEDCNFTGGTGSYDLYVTGTDGTTGTRSIQRNAFGKGVNVNTSNFTCDDNVLGDATTLNANDTFVSFDGNLIYQTTGDIAFRSSTSNGYFVNTATTNPHGISVGYVTASHTGWVFDFPAYASGDVGDAFLGVSPGSAATVTLTGNILLPNSSGAVAGTLVTFLGNANLTFAIEHNTAFGEVVCGETYDAHAGMCSSFRSNITFIPSGTMYKFDNIDGTPNNDVVTDANADYNCGYGITAGSEGKGYNTPITGTPGANDVDEDPDFEASTRNIKTWDTSLGGAGTTANAITELLKLNTTGHDADYTIANLRTYVRAGYVPHNASLNGTAHDAGDIGAMDYAPGGSPVPIIIQQIYRK